MLRTLTVGSIFITSAVCLKTDWLDAQLSSDLASPITQLNVSDSDIEKFSEVANQQGGLCLSKPTRIILENGRQVLEANVEDTTNSGRDARITIAETRTYKLGPFEKTLQGRSTLAMAYDTQIQPKCSSTGIVLYGNDDTVLASSQSHEPDGREP